MTDSNSARYSWVRIFFGVGVLLIVVGAGNVIVGHSRTLEYTRALSKADHRRTSRNSPNPPRNRPGEDYFDVISRLKSRIEFYELVEQGGKMLMVFGAFSFIIGIIAFRFRQDEGDSPEIPAESP